MKHLFPTQLHIKYALEILHWTKERFENGHNWSRFLCINLTEFFDALNGNDEHTRAYANGEFSVAYDAMETIRQYVRDHIAPYDTVEKFIVQSAEKTAYDLVTPKVARAYRENLLDRMIKELS